MNLARRWPPRRPAAFMVAAVLALGTGVGVLSNTDLLAGRGIGRGLTVPSTREPPWRASRFLSESPPAPCRGVAVRPGVDIQGLIDAHPDGTSFCLAAGVYRLRAPLVPKDGQTFIGTRATVLSGARPLTAWTREGRRWRTVTRIERSRSGRVTCDPGFLCDYNEDVTFDDRFLRRVASPRDVGPGRYSIDYVRDTVFIGDDPSGHEVEVGIARAAFGSEATGVVIRDLVIEKFASPGQSAAVAAAGTGWRIENNEVRFNHGIGICAWAGGALVRNNFVHHNGEMGLCGQRAGNVFEGNEVSFNAPQAVGFSVFWEGGGSKFVSNTGLVVRRNFVHDNRGNGLWTDSNNIDVLYEENWATNNSDAGILHEISCQAVIRNNYVAGNGFFREGNRSYWGGGIVNWQSPDVEVYGNIVEGNNNGIMAIMTPRGSGACGTFEVRNFWVHHNQIRQSPSGHAAGLALHDMRDATYFGREKNNRFDHNSYVVGPGSRFWWRNGEAERGEWVRSGNDRHGAFDRSE